MAEDEQVRPLSEKEIENLADSLAEREAFVKSTAVLVLVWAVSFVGVPFVTVTSIRLYSYIVPWRSIYVVVAFLMAFAAGLATRWIVKDSAYKKYYTQYKEQQNL